MNIFTELALKSTCLRSAAIRLARKGQWVSDILQVTMSLAIGSPANSRSRHVLQVARFAWATLGCNVAVVLWGAFVRATGSGAGCGNKWPICNGDVLGASARTQTIIEFTHRVSSAVALLMVAGLVFWCWRVTSKGDWARYAAVLAAAFLANEALLGGALVLLGHVAQDQSAGRIVFLCLHFGNTLLLLAMLTLTAAWLRGGSFKFRARSSEIGAVAVGLLATMLIGITGAVAALGDTLFPATSLRSSLLQDFSAGTPALLRFRVLHPAVAAVAAGYIFWLIFRSSTRRGRFSPPAVALIVALFAQIGLGVMNVILLAPVWVQIVHLLLGDVFWILLVLASVDLLLEPATRTLAS